MRSFLPFPSLDESVIWSTSVICLQLAPPLNLLNCGKKNRHLWTPPNYHIWIFHNKNAFTGTCFSKMNHLWDTGKWTIIHVTGSTFDDDFTRSVSIEGFQITHSLAKQYPCNFPSFHNETKPQQCEHTAIVFSGTSRKDNHYVFSQKSLTWEQIVNQLVKAVAQIALNTVHIWRQNNGKCWLNFSVPFNSHKMTADARNSMRSD